jgi:hypothetical protein
MSESTEIRAHTAKATNPGEVDDDVKVADESLLDPGRGPRGRPLEEAPAVLRVDEGLGVDGAEEARLVLLQRLPRPVVRVGALPRLQDAALGGILLLLVFLVMVAATPRDGGRRVEAASAAANAVHDAEAAVGRRRVVGSRTGGEVGTRDQDMGQAGCAGLGLWAFFFGERDEPLFPTSLATVLLDMQILTLIQKYCIINTPSLFRQTTNSLLLYLVVGITDASDLVWIDRY